MDRAPFQARKYSSFCSPNNSFSPPPPQCPTSFLFKTFVEKPAWVSRPSPSILPHAPKNIVLRCPPPISSIKSIHLCSSPLSQQKPKKEGKNADMGRGRRRRQSQLRNRCIIVGPSRSEKKGKILFPSKRTTTHALAYFGGFLHLLLQIRDRRRSYMGISSPSLFLRFPIREIPPSLHSWDVVLRSYPPPSSSFISSSVGHQESPLYSYVLNLP